MKNIILTFILFTSGTLFAQKADSLNLEQNYHKIDSIKYSESDFMKTQKYFKEHSELDAELDNLKSRKEYFEREIKNDKRIIDSLKNK